ncbi:hypothetical protein O3P69_013731 [Scylla paramamosain]|uniref:Uncharacterized protein n=1 Tax=Scylla paramamosain TaxID=85552 RepID=A0AAW0SRB0_SCYPA
MGTNPFRTSALRQTQTAGRPVHVDQAAEWSCYIRCSNLGTSSVGAGGGEVNTTTKENGPLEGRLIIIAGKEGGDATGLVDGREGTGRKDGREGGNEKELVSEKEGAGRRDGGEGIGCDTAREEPPRRPGPWSRQLVNKTRQTEFPALQQLPLEHGRHSQ